MKAVKPIAVTAAGSTSGRCAASSPLIVGPGPPLPDGIALLGPADCVAILGGRPFPSPVRLRRRAGGIWRSGPP